MSECSPTFSPLCLCHVCVLGNSCTQRNVCVNLEQTEATVFVVIMTQTADKKRGGNGSPYTLNTAGLKSDQALQIGASVLLLWCVPHCQCLQISFRVNREEEEGEKKKDRLACGRGEYGDSLQRK